MSKLEQLARFESANSAVAFRKDAYGARNRSELLRDLIGLANAAIEGPRYIFLGIEDLSAGDASRSLLSQQSREKYESLLAARNVSRDVHDRVGSRIERLVHAQVFGEDQPYSPSSTATLVRRVQSVDGEFEAVGARVIRVQAAIGPVPAGARVMAFREPLRLCLREPAIGKTLALNFRLRGKSLREPVAGRLRIEVVSDGTTVGGA